jgi:hypothetical protein
MNPITLRELLKSIRKNVSGKLPDANLQIDATTNIGNTAEISIKIQIEIADNLSIFEIKTLDFYDSIRLVSISGIKFGHQNAAQRQAYTDLGWKNRENVKTDKALFKLSKYTSNLNLALQGKYKDSESHHYTQGGQN